MTILLVGRGPRLAWVRSVLDAARAQARPNPAPELEVVDSPPTRERMIALAGRPIDGLVLVDHFPFAAGPPAKGVALDQAIRGEAQRAIFALELARRAARVLVLAGSEPETWPAALAGMVAGAARPQPAGPCPAVPAMSRLPSTPLMSAYLEPLFTGAARPAPLALAWPRECFFDGDNPGKTLPAVMEVAGRGRILAYGPYLPLPAGRWHATVYLGFSPDIEKMPFIFEADTGGTVSRGLFEVVDPGIFTLGLDFEVTDALHPVEVRLVGQDAALEGQASLIEVALKHLAPGSRP